MPQRTPKKLSTCGRAAVDFSIVHAANQHLVGLVDLAGGVIFFWADRKKSANHSGIERHALLELPARAAAAKLAKFGGSLQRYMALGQ